MLASRGLFRPPVLTGRPLSSTTATSLGRRSSTGSEKPRTTRAGGAASSARSLGELDSSEACAKADGAAVRSSAAAISAVTRIRRSELTWLKGTKRCANYLQRCARIPPAGGRLCPQSRRNTDGFATGRDEPRGTAAEGLPPPSRRHGRRARRAGPAAGLMGAAGLEPATSAL